jgi:hypothetical protein
MRPLTTNLDREECRPYFLYDEDLSVTELRQQLASAPEEERLRLLAKILREARDDEVWKFTTPAAVVAAWDFLAPHLGRRRPFWEFLLQEWKRLGILA